MHFVERTRFLTAGNAIGTVHSADIRRAFGPGRDRSVLVLRPCLLPPFALFTKGYRTSSIEMLNPEYYFNEYSELTNIVNLNIRN